MQNLITAKDLADILDRVDQLSPKSRAAWGKMNVNTMICHTTDYFRMAYGDIPTKRRHSYLYQNFMKWWILRQERLPRSMPTVLEIDPKQGQATPSSDFESDRFLLKKILLGFVIAHEKEFVVHPRFGKLTKQEYGRLFFLHLDHHLRQFGV
jgi:hypothetical protein